uniref:Uncharacterized protein n=1 Tax=Quercus lobata TaxID=97700 RepID=A0A7N2LYF0_QUELO
MTNEQSSAYIPGALDLMTDLLHNLQYKTMNYGFHMTITKWDEVVSKEMEIVVKEKGINSFKFFKSRY